jgi:rubrerythrin
MGVALRAETKAHEFFVKALPRIADPEVRALFEELREEEVLHQNLVRDAMKKLPRGLDPDPDDYVDEPTGQ